jgi:hypothetical protein
VPGAGTLTKVVIVRSNTTSQVTWTLRVNGVTQATLVMAAAQARAFFDVSVVVAAEDGIAVEYNATAGSGPDFTTGTVYWEASS